VERRRRRKRIGRLGDLTIGRCSKGYSIADGRWSIYLEFHGLDHLGMVGINVGIILLKLCKINDIDTYRLIQNSKLKTQNSYVSPMCPIVSNVVKKPSAGRLVVGSWTNISDESAIRRSADIRFYLAFEI
jgi:hypothetical protein